MHHDETPALLWSPDATGHAKLRCRRASRALHHTGALRTDGRWRRGRNLHAAQPARHGSANHELRGHRHLAHRAGPQRALRRRGPGLRPAGGISRAIPLLRLAHRPLWQPHRQGPLPARRQIPRSGDQQPAQYAARRQQRLRQGGVERHRRAGDRAGPRARAHLRQSRRRGRVSRNAHRAGRLHADRRRCAEARSHRDHGSRHRRQPHPAFLFQPARPGRHPGPRGQDRCRPVYASGCHIDPDG